MSSLFQNDSIYPFVSALSFKFSSALEHVPQLCNLTTKIKTLYPRRCPRIQFSCRTLQIAPAPVNPTMLRFIIFSTSSTVFLSAPLCHNHHWAHKSLPRRTDLFINQAVPCCCGCVIGCRCSAAVATATLVSWEAVSGSRRQTPGPPGPALPASDNGFLSEAAVSRRAGRKFNPSGMSCDAARWRGRGHTGARGFVL